MNVTSTVLPLLNEVVVSGLVEQGLKPDSFLNRTKLRFCIVQHRLGFGIVADQQRPVSDNVERSLNFSELHQYPTDCF